MWRPQAPISHGSPADVMQGRIHIAAYRVEAVLQWRRRGKAQCCANTLFIQLFLNKLP